MDLDEQENRFLEWMNHNEGILIKIARSFSHAPEDIDDLLQEILLQVWKSIPSFNKQSSNGTWIYRVAFNRALIWKRNETKRHQLLSSLFTDASHYNEKRRSKDPRIDVLYTAIKKLDKTDRALVLMALDGLSYREISTVIDITENNVGVRLSRLKKKLTQLVKEEDL